MDSTGKLGMRALYYIALMRDVDNNGMDTDNKNTGEPQRVQWLKSNQNRLNQNFSIISGELESIAERLDALEKG